jgi:hypothetical protein
MSQQIRSTLGPAVHRAQHLLRKVNNDGIIMMLDSISGFRECTCRLDAIMSKCLSQSNLRHT